MDPKEKDIAKLIARVIAEASDGASNCEVLMRGKQYPSVQEFASAIPNHLLLGSLLEHLCCVYERDPARSRVLFKVIGQRLAAMNLLSPLAISDEFCTVRLQHNRAFTELLHTASSSLFPQNQMYLNTDTQRLPLRQKEGLFQTQTSRYLSEFEETSPLGKGSYGKVFKVTNKLDGQHYAVKKVLIKNWSRDDCMKVLREVKVLSSLQHTNVVGYHTAWIEHAQPVTTSNPKQVLPALESPAQRESSEDSSSAGSSIVFESSEVSRDSKPPPKPPAQQGEDSGQAVCPKTLQRAPNNYVPCVFLDWAAARDLKDSWDGSALTEDESRVATNNNSSSCAHKAGEQWADRKTSREVQFHLMLYIQMQLCERSLKDWISERNARSEGERGSGGQRVTPADPYSCVDAEQTLSILRRVLEGVEYIHSRGIMHRDLKPRNIFLHGHDCHVRIGDFGLACRDIIVDDHETLPSNLDTGFSHTTGVGTFVYAAPEQLEGSQYDSKSDMYSLGVVALELFHPFGTEMERVRTLGHLREGDIPESFCERWPLLAKYVRQLTSRNSSRRPSATQLLQSALFSNKDLVIHGLQKRVEEQEEEINQLRRQISRLQSSHPPDET